MNLFFFLLSFSILAMSSVSLVRAQYSLDGSAWPYGTSTAAAEEQNGDKPISVRSFEFEIHSAYIGARIDNLLMAGALARLYIFDVENTRSHLTIRYSVDLRNGDMWFIPYYGVTIPRIGGFEVGVKGHDDAQFHLPGWITWRIFGGDERVFAISADILTNVPIGSIGYYDAGIRFRVKDDGSMLYLGFANYGKNQDEVFVFGPAVKSWWALSEGSFLTLNGSYILRDPGPPHDYVRFTAGIGWRVVF